MSDNREAVDRGVMVRAAELFDAAQRKQASLEEQLHKAIAGLEAQNQQMAELRLLLEQERNNTATYRAERDQAYTERADALAILSNIRAMVEQPEIPLPAPRARRRNGKPDHADSADAGGGIGPGAIGSS